MVPIVLCSILMLAICIERFYTLNPKKIAPPHLLATVWNRLSGEEPAPEVTTRVDEDDQPGDPLAEPAKKTEKEVAAPLVEKKTSSKEKKSPKKVKKRKKSGKKKSKGKDSKKKK